jgi:hypothetical protein
VESTVNSNGENGSSATVHIETDNNGVVQEQTITKTAPPGVPLNIEVATSSGAGSVNINSYIRAGSSNMTATTSHGRFGHHGSVAASSSAVFEASTTIPVPEMDLSAQIRAFFAHFFGFFGL